MSAEMKKLYEEGKAPACTVCGRIAHTQCIDGDWWPPCEHAKTHGLKTLRYVDEVPHA